MPKVSISIPVLANCNKIANSKIAMPFIFFILLTSYKFKFSVCFTCVNCTIKLVNNSTATLDGMRKVRAVLCPDFFAQL